MPDLTNDFMATRAQAAKGDDSWMRQLASSPSSAPSGSATPAPGSPSLPGGGGGRAAAGGGVSQPQAGAPSPASPPAAGSQLEASAQDSSQPFGVRFSNWVAQKQRESAADVDAQYKPLPAAGAAFTSDVAGAWSALKSDVMATFAQSQAKLDPKYLKEDLWSQMQDQFQQQLRTGKTVVDALGLALSPLKGAFDEATTAAAKGAAVVAPIMPAGAYNKIFHKAIVGLGGETGALEGGGAVLAKAGGVAEGTTATDEAAAAASTPKGQSGAAPAAAAASGSSPAAGAATPPASGGVGRTFSIAGEAADQAPKITPELKQRAADFLAGKRDNPIDVHLDALADPASRALAIKDIAKAIPKDGVKGDDVTEMGAYSLNLSPQEVIASIRPQFPSDEHWWAAEMALNSASKALHDAATKAVETGLPEDRDAATRAYAIVNDFVGAMRAADTDTGRALRIRQVAQGERTDFTKNILDAVNGIGPDNVEEVIRKIATLDDPAKASPFVSSLRWMGSREGMLYGWYNWLLSHAVIGKKVLSDVSMAAYNVPVRYAAEKFGSGAVAPGETGALLRGYLGSMSDGIRAASKALKSGQSQFEGEYQSLFDGRLMSRGAKLNDGGPAALETGEGAPSPTMSAIEYLRMAMPTSAMAAADDFAKVINYRAEIHAMAYRSGVAQGLEGDALESHVGGLVNNVQEGMHHQAVAAALRNTLQEPLEGVAKQIQQTFDDMNIPIGKTGIEIPIGKVIMPFTKISANVLRYAYRNSPLPLIAPSKAFLAEVQQGGAARDLAYARVGLGTAVSMIVGGMAVGGMITGGGPSAPDLQAAWRRAGNQPYSIKLPGMTTAVRYDRVEPIGSLISAIADTHELLKYAKDEDGDAAAASLVLGIGHAMINKTYMQGLADFIDAVHEPDQSGARYGENLLATMAMPGEAAMLDRGVDQFVRMHHGLVDSIWARTPGMSNTLPAMQNLWGEDIKRDDAFLPPLFGGSARALSPITFGPGQDAAPIDKWIWDHRESFPNGAQGRLGLERPGQVFSSNGVNVKLTDQQLHRLRELSGNATKDPDTGLGAKDALNALVQGEYPDRARQAQWNRATPERQALMVMSLWRGYREGAKGDLVKGDKALQDTLQTAGEAKQAMTKIQMPTMP